MDTTEALEQSQPGLLSRVTGAIRKHHLNHRAEQTYLHWISRFVLFHNLKNPETLQPDDQQMFLSYLTERLQVSRARLNQAKQALAFFYKDVLGRTGPEGTVAA